MLCSARAPRPPRSSRVAISSALRTRRVIFLRYLIIHCFCRCFVRVRDVGDLVPISVSILHYQAGASSPPCTRVFGFVRTVSSSLPRGEGVGVIFWVVVMAGIPEAAFKFALGRYLPGGAPKCVFRI